MTGLRLSAHCVRVQCLHHLTDKQENKGSQATKTWQPLLALGVQEADGGVALARVPQLTFSKEMESLAPEQQTR